MWLGIDKEVKALILANINNQGNLRYGFQTELSKKFKIPVSTINDWVYEVRHGKSRHKKV